MLLGGSALSVEPLAACPSSVVTLTALLARITAPEATITVVTAPPTGGFLGFGSLGAVALDELPGEGVPVPPPPPGTQRGVPWTTYLALLECLQPTLLTLRLSDRFLPASVTGDDWLGLVTGWGALEESSDGAPGSAELVLCNTRPVAGRARFSDLVKTPLNVTGAYEFIGASVTFFRLDAGTTTPTRIGVLSVEDTSEDDDRFFRLRLRDPSLRLEQQVGLTRITRAAFPSCPKDLVGMPIPRPFGTLIGIPAIPLVAGTLGRLVGDVAADATSLTVVGADGADLDATDLASGLIILGQEEVSFTGRAGNVLSGCTRGANGTVADAHQDGAAVLELLTTYVYAVGEHGGGFPISAVTNVLTEGRLSDTPTVTLDHVVGDRHLATISIPRSIIVPLQPVAAGPVAVSVSSFDSGTFSGSQGGSATRTVAVPAVCASATTTQRTLGISAERSGNLVGFVEFHVYRRLTGEASPGTLMFEHYYGSFVGGVIGVQGHIMTWESAADEIITINWGGSQTNDARLTMSFAYTVSVPSGGFPDRPGGPHASAVDAALGSVTCDVVGIEDDAAGTLTGTPETLLENPADITRYLLTMLYPATALTFGASWAVSRAILATGGQRWALLFGAEGPVALSDFRTLVARQAPGALYVEAGAWEFRVVEDPVIVRVLAYGDDLWDGRPAIATRTPATGVFTSVLAQAGRDYQAGAYRLLATAEVPGVVPVQQILELPWIQDAAYAQAFAAYWLTVWQRPRWEIELVGWENLLGLRLGDHIAIEDHPILAGHGGTSLAFRITERGYLLSDDNPARIRLRAMEGNL